MPSSLVGHIVDAMDGRGIPALDARVLVIGVTTDPDTTDVRDSAAVEVILGLREKGAWVVYHDPLVDHLVERGLDLRSVPLEKNRVKAADCVVLSTPTPRSTWRRSNTRPACCSTPTAGYTPTRPAWSARRTRPDQAVLHVPI